MPSSNVRPSFTASFPAAPAHGGPRPASAPTASAIGLPRLTACAAALILSGLPVVSHAAKQSPESEIFTRMDFPDGLPFLGADTRMKAALKQRWQEAQARGGFVSDGEPRVNSLGMLERVQISPNYPVPASALTGALDGQVWNEFWVLRSQSAVEGQQQAPQSTATRYALRCQPLTVMELGPVYFSTLDASGDPTFVFAEYNRVRSGGIYQTSTPGHMARVKETCGKEFDALQQQQAEARAKEEAARIEDIQKVLAVQLHKALDPATAVQIGTLFRATMAPEPAAPAPGAASAPASTSELTPEANAKAAEAAMARLKALQHDPTVFDDKGEPRPARLRVFAVNGGAAFLHKGAACYSDDTELMVGGGLANSFKSLTGTASNLSIGMPETERSRQVQAGGWNMGNQWYYQEHELPPAEVSTLRLTVGNCRWVSAAFMPVPGVDYEAHLVAEPQLKRCLMTINRILPAGDLKPVPLLPAEKCTPEEIAVRRAAAEERAAMDKEIARMRAQGVVPPVIAPR